MGIHICGGTLIRVSPKVEESDIFITAAHCVEDTSRTIKALFGAHNSDSPEKGTEVIEVAQVVTHPKYRMKAFNDIAIMKLVRPVKFGPWIQPACLPAAGEQVPDGATAVVSGWGRNAENGTGHDLLHQVSLPVINPQECIDMFKKKDYPLAIRPEVHLCAAYPEGGKDTCQGDSGGPLVVKGSNGYVLQGVVSFGKGCARAGWPGVYARVSTYIDWINETVKALSSVPMSG
jgi:transmembrane serine protease 3